MSKNTNKYKVICFNILYKTNISYWTINSSNLESLINHGSYSVYDGTSAPKQIEIEVETDKDILDAEAEIKRKLEDETGLEIKSFSYSIKNCIL